MEHFNETLFQFDIEFMKFYFVIKSRRNNAVIGMA